MKPPKFAIGESVYRMLSLFTVESVSDRYWDADREDWRYKLGHHKVWFLEEPLRSELEVREIREEPVEDEDDEDEDFEDDSYDGDTGRALVNWLSEGNERDLVSRLTERVQG